MTFDPAHLEWEGTVGARARFVALHGDAVELLSTTAMPPGSRPEGRLLDAPDKVRIKVHTCQARGDGTFVIRGRTIDWTREMKDHVGAAIAAPAPSALGPPASPRAR